MLLGAVALIVLLMVIGWRRPWDPTPAVLPPVTLKTARNAAATVRLPRWYWPIALVGIGILPLSLILSGLLGQRWIAIAGLLVYAVSWGARLAAISWSSAGSRLQRVIAVFRPAVLIAGVSATAATGSWWWIVGAGVAFVAAHPVTELLEGRSARLSASSTTVD
jgi:hypothetical protein